MRRVLAVLLLVTACAGGTSPETTLTSTTVASTATSSTSSTSSSTSTTTTSTTTAPTTTTSTTTTTAPPAPTTTPAPTTPPPPPTTAAPTTTRPPATTPTTPAAPFRLAYQKIADRTNPIHLVARPGSSNAYLATKDGRVWLMTGSTIAATPVLDIRSKVSTGSEQGLLALALHPSSTSRLFVHYTNTSGNTVVSEFTLSSASTANPSSERVIFTHTQPRSNHNGGMIQFGPGGLLFLGLGDGGGGGDPDGNGQNPSTLLGGIVTLRVDGDPQPTLYSMGLRNPWRTWIDGSTFYVADVGQDRREEINVVSMTSGLNFGWPIMEADACYSPSSGCNTSGLRMPVVVVQHGDQGTCSITGGVVYRGSISEISGHYFYSDYCGGYLRSFRWTGSVSNSTNWTSQVGNAGRVLSFGVDGAGEMYVLTTSAIYKVVRG